MVHVTSYVTWSRVFALGREFSTNQDHMGEVVPQQASHGHRTPFGAESSFNKLHMGFLARPDQAQLDFVSVFACGLTLVYIVLSVSVCGCLCGVRVCFVLVFFSSCSSSTSSAALFSFLSCFLCVFSILLSIVVAVGSCVSPCVSAL